MLDWYRLLRPLLFLVDAETSHNIAAKVMRSTLFGLFCRKPKSYRRLRSDVLGMHFKNPVGMAAGLDKDAALVAPLQKCGFGFVEVGTVTPMPQPGNPKPRLFRLQEDKAIINRMGFNNKGVGNFIANLHDAPRDAVLGINIGKNKTSEDATADYVSLMRSLYSYADYMVVNISSPNTPNLRDLQQGEALDALLKAIKAERVILEEQYNTHVPLFVKVAPDLDIDGCHAIVDAVVANHVDGLIVSNTTIERPDALQSRHRVEIGGLSGAPLLDKSTEVLKQFYKLTEGQVILIGVGGIASAEDAYQKIRAGASLVQVYSALIYQGFGLVADIVEGLDRLLERDGFDNIIDAVGADVDLTP